MNEPTRNAGDAVPSDENIAVRQEIPADAAGADERLRAWSTLKNLQHDSLLKVHDSGTAISDGVRVVYCVHERSDGNLGTALRDGPLQDAAVIELITEVREAVEYLHQRGFAIGGVDASFVHASGSRTKLFPHRLESVTESLRTDDLRSLGMLAARASGATEVRAIADPKLRAIAETLRSEKPRSATTPVEQVHSPPPSASRGKALAFAAALLLAVIAIYVFTGRSSVDEQKTGATPVVADDRLSAVPSAAPDPEGELTNRARVSPSPPKPQPAPRSAEPARVRTSGGEGGWAVIAATYKSYSAAERRATRLKSTYDDCACSVFPSEGEGSNYYVVVGSNLSRAAADQLRQNGVRAGLPRDSYVTMLAGRTSAAR